MFRREVIGEHRVDEHDFGAGVGQDVLQLLACQAQVQWIDDACPEEAGVVELEELVSVARHDPEPVVGAETELPLHGVAQSQHPVRMRVERGVVHAVVEADL